MNINKYVQICIFTILINFLVSISMTPSKQAISTKHSEALERLKIQNKNTSPLLSKIYNIEYSYAHQLNKVINILNSGLRSSDANDQLIQSLETISNTNLPLFKKEKKWYQKIWQRVLLPFKWLGSVFETIKTIFWFRSFHAKHYIVAKIIAIAGGVIILMEKIIALGKKHL